METPRTVTQPQRISQAQTTHGLKRARVLHWHDREDGLQTGQHHTKNQHGLTTLSLAALIFTLACSSPLPETQSPLKTQPALDATPDQQSADTQVDTPQQTTPTQVTPEPTELTPDFGPIQGLQVLTIHGQALGHVVTVLLGETPALQVDAVDDQTLIVVTPPHPAGLVDVTLRTTDPALDVVIPQGYQYVAQVTLLSVEPKFGPLQGGTAVTVTGTGFNAQTRFAIGHRLGLLPSILDDHTATFLTPPGETGPQRVAVMNPGNSEFGSGSAQLPHAFTYRGPPQLLAVTPAVLPWKVTGGSQLVLHGHGLAGPLLEVHLHALQGSIPAQVLATDGETLRVQLGEEPQPGVYDVTVTHADGQATLAQAVVLADVSQTQPGTQNPLLAWAIMAVTPPELPVNQPRTVRIAVTGFASQQVWQQAQKLQDVTVEFDDQPAQVLSLTPAEGGQNDFLGAMLDVLPPPPLQTKLPATVKVQVHVAGHDLVKFDGFTWLKAGLKIETLQPQTLDPQGGTPVTLTWGPLAENLPIALRIGALPATGLQVQGNTVNAHAPPGAEGRADVTLLWADGQTATLHNGVEFRGNSHEILGLVANTGAQAGGRLLDVLGTGLNGMSSLLIGKGVAADLQVMDSGWATVRTPRGDPGPVDVQATWGLLGLKPPPHALLRNGFTYFDPKAGNGGTWGPIIDGALNVTVVKRSDSMTPIVSALVIAESPLKTWQGFTDDRGQITFSGPEMVPPVRVHASKPDYTAGSLIALSSENATIRLTSTKPSNGKGNGDDTPVPPNGTITGTVLDAEKYTVLPAGTCSGEILNGIHCLPCTSDDICGANASCELIGLSDASTVTSGGNCAQVCTSASECPSGYTCGQFGSGVDARLRCRPIVGEAQVRCESAGGSIYGGIAQKNDGIVGSNGIFNVTALPGATAVICRSGYVDKHTGNFVALALGIVRHLFTNPGQTVTGVQVHVRVALDREIRVHMLDLPQGPDTDGGQRSLTAGVDLGADGYIPLGTTTTTQKTDTLVLTKQPNDALFADENADLRYELYGGVATSYGGPPQSTALATGRAVTGLEHAAIWPPNQTEPHAAPTSPGAWHACAAAGPTRVCVGDGGKIAAWTGGDFTVQASPTSQTLRAVWLADDDAATAGLEGWAAGENGALAQRTPLGWKLWPSSLGQTVVALQGRAANDVWALHPDGHLHRWTPLAKNAPTTWLAVAGPPIPSTLQFHALALLPSGDVLIAGDAGALWLGKATKLPGIFDWQALGAQTTATIRALHLAQDGTVWLAGDRGYLAHFNGASVDLAASGTTRNLYAFYQPLTGPLQVVGAQGTWLKILNLNKTQNHALSGMPVDLRGVLPTFDGGQVAAGEPVVEMGPYLEMPYPLEPTAGAKLGLKVRWTAAPGNTPTLNLLRLADQTYTTRWEIFVHGALMEVTLPDFPLLGQFSPLPTGPLYLRQWRILAPQLDINALNPKLLSQAVWISWAYNVTQVLSPMSPPGTPNPPLPLPEPPSAWPFPK